jgi:hypothetical protein
MVINRVKDLLAGRRAAASSTGNPASDMRAAPPNGSVPPAPQEAASHAGGTLEDYFDRLDAAFATLDATPGDASPVVPPPQAPASSARPPLDFSPPAAQPQVPVPYATSDDLAGWDPDLTRDPASDLPAPASVAAPAYEASGRHAPVALHDGSSYGGSHAPAAYTAPMAPPAATREFVSALAPAVPAPVPSLADAFAALLSAEQAHPVAPSAIGGAVSGEMVEEIVERVIARMADHNVREAVLEVAERLVREEIDRIKHA